MPTPARATSCLLVRDAEQALLLDAGTGVANLCRQPDLLDGVGRIDVVLSHFHLDHVAGLTYLPAVAADVELTIWAPGHLLLGATSREVLETVVGAPFLSVSLTEFAQVAEIVDGTQQVSRWTVEARVQPRHPGGSVGYRLGDLLAYCTDTAPDPDCASFVQGAALLVHEAWTASSPTHEHSSAASAAETAAEAAVERLVLSHVHPLNDNPDGLLAAARPIFASTEVGHDGQAFA
jgi:ribonuclease BN (tRNA processing enzyme)